MRYGRVQYTRRATDSSNTEQHASLKQHPEDMWYVCDTDSLFTLQTAPVRPQLLSRALAWTVGVLYGCTRASVEMGALPAESCCSMGCCCGWGTPTQMILWLAHQHCWGAHPACLNYNGRSGVGPPRLHDHTSNGYDPESSLSIF